MTHQPTTPPPAAGFDPYGWGFTVGSEIARGTREPFHEVWRNADGSEIAWRTSGAPFPRGYRDGLRAAAPVDLSPLDLPAPISARPTWRARVGEVRVDSGRMFGVIIDVTLERETGVATTTTHRPIVTPVRLSISGEVSRTDGRRSDGAVYESAGQCVEYLDRLDRLSPGWSADEVSELASLWRRWHLNTMRAACAHMSDDTLIRESDGYGGTRIACGPVNTCEVSGYTYGRAWLVEPLPADMPGTLARLMRDRSADLYAARGYDAHGRAVRSDGSLS